MTQKDVDAFRYQRGRSVAAASFASSLLSRTCIAALAMSLFAITACTQSLREAPAPPDAQIHALLDAQQLAWNRGDIEDFMQGYWHDKALSFESGNNVSYGWQATYDHYIERYPDRAAMGRLLFSDVQIGVLDSDHATVSGGWELQRAADRPHGSFVLDLRRFEKNWKIVKDHTEKAS